MSTGCAVCPKKYLRNQENGNPKEKQIKKKIYTLEEQYQNASKSNRNTSSKDLTQHLRHGFGLSVDSFTVC